MGEGRLTGKGDHKTCLDIVRGRRGLVPAPVGLRRRWWELGPEGWGRKMRQRGCQLHKGKGQRGLTLVPGKEDPQWKWRRENRETLFMQQVLRWSEYCENQCCKVNWIAEWARKDAKHQCEAQTSCNLTGGTANFHEVYFRMLQAEFRCSTGFPLSRLSYNIFSWKLKFIAFWIRYLHIITPGVFALSCCLVPSSYHQTPASTCTSCQSCSFTWIWCHYLFTASSS